MSAECEDLAKEITDNAFAWLREHHNEPFTPALVKQAMIAVMDEYREKDLEQGIDYRIESKGTLITITPLSPRCIEWFERCQLGNWV